jgi:hypothetical protein
MPRLGFVVEKNHLMLLFHAVLLYEKHISKGAKIRIHSH